jgi:peptidoglycan/LPS O-acetylase OafA/YrhL
MMLHTRVDTLMFGCALALYGAHPVLRHARDWVLRSRIVVPATIYVLIVSPWLARVFHGSYTITIGMTIEGLAIATLLLWAVERADSPVGKVLNSRVFVHIGIISYSLYLWQQLFTSPTPILGTRAILPNVLGLIAAAELSYWLIERSFLRLRARVSPRARSVGRAATSPPEVVSS